MNELEIIDQEHIEKDDDDHNSKNENDDCENNDDSIIDGDVGDLEAETDYSENVGSNIFDNDNEEVDEDDPKNRPDIKRRASFRNRKMQIRNLKNNNSDRFTNGNTFYI